MSEVKRPVLIETKQTHDQPAASKKELKAPQPRVPKIEILELREDQMRFELRDTDLSVANALRRTMICDVPIMAIEEAIVIENTSLLNDQMLCARFAQVPLDSRSVDKYVDWRQCDCAHSECERCAAELTLEVRNDTEDIMEVTSAHIMSATDVRPVHTGKTSKGSLESKLSVAGRFDSTAIVIAKLSPRQEISVRMVARKGVGSEHAKWNPTATVTFQQPADVHVEASELTDAQQQQLVKACPRKVFAMSTTSAKPQIVVADNMKCNYCGECGNLADKWGRKDAVTTVEQPGRFIFEIESTGALPVTDIMQSAMARLLARLCVVQKESPVVRQ